MRPQLHLPNIPSIPRPIKRLTRAAGKGLHTKNPFAYLSGSIAASHKRKLAKHPK